MSEMRVAVTSRSFSKHSVLRTELLEQYSNVTFNNDGLALSGNELIDYLAGHDAAITALEKITGDVLSQVPQLKIISKYGVGFDMLEIQAFRKHGVRLGWTGGVNKRSVSELVVANAIALLRKVHQCRDEVLSGTWRQTKGRQLSGRTVGIIGCGHVGKDLVELLSAFDCCIYAHDILDFPEFYATSGVTPKDLDYLLENSDIVTLHLPLDDSTRGLISEERLALMKHDAILINAARGGLVNEAALKDALIAGRLGGAAFDVFEPEPPEDDELLRLPNFIVTPHIGGSSEEAVLAMGRAAIDGLRRARIPDDQWPQ